MEQPEKKMKLRIFGYILFIVLCVIIAAYRHFPGSAMSNYLQQEVIKLNSNLKLDITGIKPSFQPGIKADRISVSFKTLPLINLKNFKIGYDLLSVFDNTAKCPFKCMANNGVISGTVILPEKKKGRLIIESKFTGLKFDKASPGKLFYNIIFSGTINGKASVAADKHKITAGQGDLTLNKVILNFEKAASAIFFVDKIAFSSVHIMFSIPEPDIIKIEKCTMTGKTLDLEASGEIKITRPFKNSALDLNASINLYPMFFMETGASSRPAKVITKGKHTETSLELAVKGTIQTPKIKILQGGGKK